MRRRRGYYTSKKFYLFYSFCIIRLEYGLHVSDEVFVVVGCNSYVIDILFTLVSLYRFVEVFAHEAREENADSDLLSPWASLLYANILLAKLKARISIDLWSAICRT